MSKDAIAAQGPLDRGVRPSRFNPARALGYPDFNEDGHALAAGPFKCPECGGWTFGSSIGKMGKAEKGYCHDAHGIGCRFQWYRADDRKYFAATAAEDGHNARSEPTARLFAQVGSTDGLAVSGSTEK